METSIAVYINCSSAPYIDDMLHRRKLYETRVKWLYPVYDVVPVPAPFIPPEGVRHGLTWMEY